MNLKQVLKSDQLDERGQPVEIGRLLTGEAEVKQALSATELRVASAVAVRGLKALQDINVSHDRHADIAVARGIQGEASVRIGDESIDQIIVPTIERIMRWDVEMEERPAEFGDSGTVRVLSAKGLAYRLHKLGIDPEYAAIAMRFANDLSKARIGGLTASYGERVGNRTSIEPDRWCESMDLLAKASSNLTHDERICVYGTLAYDVSAGDLGAFVCGNVKGEKNNWCFTTKLLMNKALNKLYIFYTGVDAKQSETNFGAKRALSCP